MLGGADNPNGELPSYITGADNASWGPFGKRKILYRRQVVELSHTETLDRCRC